MFLTIRDAKLSLGNLNDVTGTAMSQQLKMGGPYAAKNRSNRIINIESIVNLIYPRWKGSDLEILPLQNNRWEITNGNTGYLSIFLFVYYFFNTLS